VGCNPYAETRAALDPAERIRFDRGVRAATPCWSCHDLTGDAFKIGPPLQGLFGRKAGAVEDFPYSPALAQSSLHWDEQNLHRFLSNPQATIPGNRMLSPSINDEGARADLIFFLSRVTRHPSRASVQ
jgi:cytochrome c